MLTVQRELAVEPALLERIGDARRKSDELFNVVQPASMYERPIPERHRIIFYVGHLEAFDWNLLHENVFGLKSFHPEFDRLFAFGIDPVGGGLPKDQPSDWPSLEMVRNYVRTIRAALDEKLVGSLDPEAHMRDGFPLNALLNVAVEHRLMHVETLAYMFHQLPLSSKIKQFDAPAPGNSLVAPSMINIPGGSAALGLSRAAASFGWDNEFEKHSVEVPAFSIDRYMVSNGQFLDFMSDGGYENRALWNDDDWNWKSSDRISHPVFWKNTGGEWLYRTMFEEIPLPADGPAYVSQAEAAAYARWVGKSLPTE